MDSNDQIQLMFAAALAVATSITSGRLRALVVTSTEQFPSPRGCLSWHRPDCQVMNLEQSMVFFGGLLTSRVRRRSIYLGGYMQLFYFATHVVLVNIVTLGAGLASAPPASTLYPSRPIRIVAAEPGGGGDFISRQVAQGISGPLGQPVIVENRGGASGSIAAQTVARALPDGYTVLLYTGTFWVFPLLQKTPYDTVRDFSPVTIVVTSPNILVASPSLAIKSVKELIALAKAKPGALNYASTGVGGSTQLATELFKSMAGISIIHVIYKGSGQAVTALIGNEVQVRLGKVIRDSGIKLN